MDNVLLKIKRQFTQDEAIKALQSELSKANFRNGELISENEELRHKLEAALMESSQFRKELSDRPILTKKDLKEAKFEEMRKNIKTQNKTIDRLRQDVNVWRDKFLNISAKTPYK